MSFLCGCGADEKQEFSLENVRAVSVKDAATPEAKQVAEKVEKELKKYDEVAKEVESLEKKNNLSNEEKKRLQAAKETKAEAEAELQKLHEEHEEVKQEEKKAKKDDKKDKDSKKKEDEEEDEKGGPINVKELWDYGLATYKENLVMAWVAAVCVGFGTTLLGLGAIPLWAGFSNMVMKADKDKDKFDIKYLFALATKDNILKWKVDGFILFIVAVLCGYTWWLFFLPPFALTMVILPFVPNLIAFRGEKSFMDALKRSKDAVFGNLGDIAGTIDSAKGDIESSANAAADMKNATELKQLNKDGKDATGGVKSALGTAEDTLDDTKATLQHVKAVVVILIAMFSVILYPAAMIMMHKRYALTLPGDKIHELNLAAMAGVEDEVNAVKNAADDIEKAKKDIEKATK